MITEKSSHRSLRISRADEGEKEEIQDSNNQIKLKRISPHQHML
jgi:hypothetical protein